LLKTFAPESKTEGGTHDKKKLGEVKEEDEDADSEDTQVKEEDIEQIMSQAGVERKQAVRALKENN